MEVSASYSCTAQSEIRTQDCGHVRQSEMQESLFRLECLNGQQYPVSTMRLSLPRFERMNTLILSHFLIINEYKGHSYVRRVHVIPNLSRCQEKEKDEVIYIIQSSRYLNGQYTTCPNPCTKGIVNEELRRTANGLRSSNPLTRSTYIHTYIHTPSPLLPTIEITRSGGTRKKEGYRPQPVRRVET